MRLSSYVAWTHPKQSTIESNTTERYLLFYRVPFFTYQVLCLEAM